MRYCAKRNTNCWGRIIYRAGELVENKPDQAGERLFTWGDAPFPRIAMLLVYDEYNQNPWKHMMLGASAAFAGVRRAAWAAGELASRRAADTKEDDNEAR
jgi:hypothetical protein